MAEMKATSMRLSEEVKDKLRELVKSEGWENQDMALAKLMSMYETEQIKAIIPNRRTEIETVETHLKAISDMFFSSLQINHDTEERVRQAYADRLESNQRTIQDLQAEKILITDTLKASIEKSKQLEKDMLSVDKEYKQALKQLETSEKLIDEYKSKNDNLTGLLGEYKAYKDSNKELNEQIKQTEKDKSNLSIQLFDLEQRSKVDILKLKEQHKTENEERNNKIIEEKNSLLKQVSDLEQRSKLDLLELKEQHSLERDQLKDKHNIETEERNREYRKLLDELNDLRQKNAELSKLIPTLPEPTATQEIVATNEVAPKKKVSSRKKTTKTDVSPEVSDHKSDN